MPITTTDIGLDNRPIFELMLQQRQGLWAKLTLLSISCRVLMFFLSVLIVLIEAKVFYIPSNSGYLSYFFALHASLWISFVIHVIWSLEMSTLLGKIKNIESEIFRLFENGSQVEDSYIRSQRREIKHKDISDSESFVWMTLICSITAPSAIRQAIFNYNSALIIITAGSLLLALVFSKRVLTATIEVLVSILIGIGNALVFPFRIIYRIFSLIYEEISALSVILMLMLMPKFVAKNAITIFKSLSSILHTKLRSQS